MRHASWLLRWQPPNARCLPTNVCLDEEMRPVGFAPLEEGHCWVVKGRKVRGERSGTVEFDAVKQLVVKGGGGLLLLRK